MKELVERFSELGKENKQILVLGHPHADPDAVSSVIALGELLENLGAKITTGIPSNIDRLSKSVLKTVGTNIKIDPSMKADSVIVLDTSSLNQLKEYRKKFEDSKPEIIFIDHHRSDEKTRKKIDKYYVDENATSTAELILELSQKLGYNFKPETALLLLTGIISDTGHLKFAEEDTFKAIATLLKQGAEYNEALEALKTPEDPSKRVAMLKAAQRLEIYKAYGRWIAFSEIGAYESDAASLFLKIGADVSAVASEDGEKISVSTRSRSGLASETQLHLGELLSKIADEFEGTGGGHAGAAAMDINGELKEVKESIIEEMKKSMKPSPEKQEN